MPDDVTTISYLDDEDWQIAFEPFEGHPQAALTLGFHLTELKRQIDGFKKHQALAAVERPLIVSMSTPTFAALAANCFRKPSKADEQPTKKKCCVTWESRSNVRFA
jgi:hypothetical protein